MRDPTALEIAATAKAEMKRHRDYLLDLVRHLDAIIEAVPTTLVRLAPYCGELREQRVAVQELADRISKQLRSRSWLYFGLLQEAVNAGVNLGYTSQPAQGKPDGPGVDYLMAEAAKHGYPLGPHRALALLKTFNDTFPRIEKFRGEGKLEVRARVFDAKGDEVIDDANRPPRG